jgi:hypothetical protein
MNKSDSLSLVQGPTVTYMIATYLSQLAQTSSALYSGHRPMVHTEFLSQWEHSAMIPNTLTGNP